MIKQLQEHNCQSVRPSVRPSVYGTFFTQFLSLYHHENLNFIDVKTPFIRFQTVTPVSIHIWGCNDAQSLVFLGRGALLLFKVMRQISRSHSKNKSLSLTQIGRFRTVTPVWIHQWLLSDTQSLKQHSVGSRLFFNVICEISRSHGTKITDYDPNWVFRTVTQVWIHRWFWNYGIKASHKIEEVSYCFSRSSIKFQCHTGQRITNFDPNWSFSNCNSSFNKSMALEWSTKLGVV